MSGSRIYAPSTWLASAAALVVLATLTVGWVRASPDAAGGNGGSGTASGDLPLRNDDGTVGPIVALGDTTTDMLARFSGDVAAWSPRVVVVLGGTNDLEAGRTTEQVLSTLGQLVELARGLGATPVLGTVPPRTDGDYAERVADLNAAIRAAGEDSGTTVIDFFAVLTDGGGGWRPGFTADGLHPTAAAADAMAELAVETLLGE